jgi:Mce-associated membrane protein
MKLAPRWMQDTEANPVVAQTDVDLEVEETGTATDSGTTVYGTTNRDVVAAVRLPDEDNTTAEAGDLDSTEGSVAIARGRRSLRTGFRGPRRDSIGRRAVALLADTLPLGLVVVATLTLGYVFEWPQWTVYLFAVTCATGLCWFLWQGVWNRAQRRQTLGQHFAGVTSPRMRARWTRTGAARAALVGCAVIATVTAVAATLTVIQFSVQYSDVSRARAQVVATAPASVVIVLTYQPDSMPDDIAAAKSKLTDPYLADYTRQANEVLMQTAVERKISLSTRVVATSVVSVKRSSATLLMTLSGTTTSPTTPAPVEVPSTVRVGMKKVGGQWLIAKMDPL